MSERAMKTTLVVGRARIPVGLVKMSGKQAEAKYETRRVEAEAVRTAAKEPADPFGMGDDIRTGHGNGKVNALADFADPPALIRHGVTGPDDEWIDLTDELAKIDEACKLDGMILDAVVARNAIPTVRVRDAHYVVVDGAPKGLAMLWRDMRERNRAVVVRWTKRTNQALGALVARGRAERDPHLILLELEWEANERPLPPRANLLAAMGEVTARDEKATARLLGSRLRSPEVFAEMQDERSARRAEVLEAARAGDVILVDADVVDDVEPEVAESFAVAAGSQ